MNADDYQKAALRTKPEMEQRTQLTMASMGLAGESGEFVDKIKKHIFHGHPLDNRDLVKELGDIMWYVAIAADALDYDLALVLEMNVEKLKKRYPEGFSSQASINRVV